MNKITKSGLICSGTENFDVIEALRYPVRVEDGTTLLDLMELVATEPDLYDFFRRYSSCPDLFHYIEEARKPATAVMVPLERVVVECGGRASTMVSSSSIPASLVLAWTTRAILSA